MWKAIDDRLIKEFEFKNFKEALEFVNKVGELAEASHHHPDILLRDYKFVLITLTTHDEGNKISEKDLEMSPKIDALYNV
jgi:4a-hydroxytetrahydrobiopterin dehydratase